MEAAKPLETLAPKKEGIRLAAAAIAAQAAAPRLRPRDLTGRRDRHGRPGVHGRTRHHRGSVDPRRSDRENRRRVFFTYQGRNASCSANAVTSENKSTVITAGHCVRMGGAFHDNWVFVPGYENGNRPYGTWVATTLYTTAQWNNSEDINYDVAAAVVAPLNGKSLTDVVGGQGVSFNQYRRQRMHSFGYPSGSPYDGSKLIYCSGRAFDDIMMSRDIGMNCNTTGGSSGGPWFLDFNESTGLGTLNSVNSFKYSFAAAGCSAPTSGPTREPSTRPRRSPTLPKYLLKVVARTHLVVQNRGS
ncbi:trypsin-like serine peptidase [Streptosporangium lutulentum]